MVVLLSDLFRGMGAWRNSTKTQQSGHAPRSGPEVKYGRSSAEDGPSERLLCGTTLILVVYVYEPDVHDLELEKHLCSFLAVDGKLD